MSNIFSEKKGSWKLLVPFKTTWHGSSWMYICRISFEFFVFTGLWAQKRSPYAFLKIHSLIYEWNFHNDFLFWFIFHLFFFFKIVMYELKRKNAFSFLYSCIFFFFFCVFWTFKWTRYIMNKSKSKFHLYINELIIKKEKLWRFLSLNWIR